MDRARALGCDEVLVWGQGDLAEKVAALTDGHKADVVYDGVGKLTFEASINSLRPRGLMVSFGASTGAPPPVEVGTLNAKGSLYLTRPGLAAHATEATEYRERAADVLDAAMTDVFSTTFWKELPLREAACVHEVIEIGRSAGPVITQAITAGCNPYCGPPHIALVFYDRFWRVTANVMPDSNSCF